MTRDIGYGGNLAASRAHRMTGNIRECLFVRGQSALRCGARGYPDRDVLVGTLTPDRAKVMFTENKINIVRIPSCKG